MSLGEIVKKCKIHGNLTAILCNFDKRLKVFSCKKCQQVFQKNYREKLKISGKDKIQKNKQMEKWYIKKYGITHLDYDILLIRQNYLCAICRKKETAVHGRSKKILNFGVDHCHITGKVRALLCRRCNQAIGVLDENILLIQACIDYLVKHKNNV